MPISPPPVPRPAALSRAVACAALAGLLVAGGCGGEPAAPAGSPAPAPEPAASVRPPAAADAVHHQRFQRLATEALRLMIAAAQRELPIGPLQERIDAARTLATRDVAAAADRMEEVVAELEALLEDGA